MTMKRSLNDILDGNEDVEIDSGAEVDEDMGDTPPFQDAPDTQQRMCVDCGDQPADKNCQGCEEDFCDVCFQYIHRTGNRAKHATLPIENSISNSTGAGTTGATTASDGAQQEPEDRVDMSLSKHSMIEPDETQLKVLALLKERAKDVPVRLTYDERKLLRLLEAALNVSEYTDKVDILSYTSKAKRIVAQLREMCSIMAALVVATDMKTGQALFENKNFSDNAEWFQTVFEIGRRYKIMNPDKMRDSFGKLMYMIMDSRLAEVSQVMEFDLYKPVKSVYSHLRSFGDGADGSGVAVFGDPLIVDAIMEINPDGKNRRQIQQAIQTKERAIEILAKRYSKGKLLKEDVRQCLYSLGDYHAYLRANQEPVERMMKYLNEDFDESADTSGEFHLAIRYGSGGARLSHNHSKQYQYVRQSLSLWSEIMKEMFRMWSLSDADLTSTGRYQLTDTGQGLNRIKGCPGVSRAIHGVISKAQHRTGSWIGSSVVHLGDHTVPNALFFLDKYLQVPRILIPVDMVVSNIENLAKDPHVSLWIKEQFGSPDRLRKTILADFFKHAFDGSGADNFYDAGSCIDGRLTSAWNWANSISKKDYYKIFLVSGFTGFDGAGF
ncbi:UPF0652 protein [Yarrowia sp. E02]|nr:UPF0652 protein [Yarrowia sp. E02]